MWRSLSASAPGSPARSPRRFGLLAGKADAEGRTIGVVIDGGNVDPEVFARALSAATPA